MKKGYLLIIILLTGAGVGLWFFMNRKKIEQPAELTQPDTTKLNGVSKETIIQNITTRENLNGFKPSDLLGVIEIESSFNWQARPYPFSEHFGLYQQNRNSVIDGLKTIGEYKDDANVSKVFSDMKTDWNLQLKMGSAYLLWCLRYAKNMRDALYVYSGTNNKTQADRDAYYNSWLKAKANYTQYD